MGHSLQRARVVAAWLAALLLLLPLSTIWPRVELALFRWDRVRATNREPPGADVDRAYRSLASFLPARGVIGFQRVSRRGDNGAERLRAQYGLAPRGVVEYAREDYLVEFGPRESERSAGQNPQFALVTVVNEDVRLYRRLP